MRPMLSCAPHAISRTLDRLRVRPDHGSISGDDGDWRRTALPSPGSFVPVEDHHLLRDDLEAFADGEYVGYELDDAQQSSPFADVTIVYAIVIRKSVAAAAFRREISGTVQYSASHSPGPGFGRYSIR